MLIGSLAGPLCAGGGFCAGSTDVVEHQRISAASYTFSAALPAMLATTASETIAMLQANPDILVQCRENIKAMRAQLDPRSDWVQCTSALENPVMILVLKPEVVNSRRLTPDEQERILQECVEEVSFKFLLPLLSSPSTHLSMYLSIYLSVTPHLLMEPPLTPLLADPRQRRAHHAPQAHGSRAQRQRRRQVRRLEDAARAQGLHHHGPVEEGDREGGRHDKACDHEGLDEEGE